MKVSVVGAGRLGLPMACILARAGHQVVAADLDESVVSSINNGDCPIRETSLTELMSQVKLTATTDIVEAARTTEITYIVVPTPSDDYGEFSNAAILTALESIGKGISQKVAEHTVVLTSTIMPGASQDVLIPALEKHSGRTVGNLLNYAYSPEFIALGSVIADMTHPDFILIGEANKRAGSILSFMYSTFIHDDEIPVSKVSVIDAEIAKISLNCFLTIKISFANMVSEFCESFAGADALSVCSVIGADSRIGHKFLHPGTASGGPCLPRDLRALDAAMGSRGVSGELVEAAISINDRQVTRLKAMVEGFNPKTVAVLGTAYKPDTAVTEASPGLALMRELGRNGRYTVIGYDPVAEGGKVLDSVLEGADVAVITTAWPEFATVDFGDKVVIDCWNIAKIGSRIYRLGQG